MASNESSMFNLQLSDKLLARDWTLSEDDTFWQLAKISWQVWARHAG